MTLWSKMQIGLLIACALLFCAQFKQHRRHARELASVEAQIQTESQKLEAQRAALTGLQQRNNELLQTERRVGNQTLNSVMRERTAAAAAPRATSQAASATDTAGIA